MNQWNKYKVEDLQRIKKGIAKYTTIEELKADIDKAIQFAEEEKKQSLNIRFNIELMTKLKILDDLELRVIRENHINNLQELIDCDLDSLIGITSPIRKELDWKRHFYDMRDLENKKKR